MSRRKARELVPEADRFSRHQRVRINYSINNPVVAYRYGSVVKDEGGPKVLVHWRAQDGPKVGRHVVAYYGAEHEQWIPRERLERAGR